MKPLFVHVMYFNLHRKTTPTSPSTGPGVAHLSLVPAVRQVVVGVCVCEGVGV